MGFQDDEDHRWYLQQQESEAEEAARLAPIRRELEAQRRSEKRAAQRRALRALLLVVGPVGLLFLVRWIFG